MWLLRRITRNAGQTAPPAQGLHATTPPSGKVALECDGLAKAYGPTSIFSGFDAIVNRGDRIVLIGRNGVGKTTLLKALLADAPGMPASPGNLDEGTLRWGTKCRSATFRRIMLAKSRRG